MSPDDLEREREDLDRQIAENQRKILALVDAGDVRGLVAAISGSIGGRVGLAPLRLSRRQRIKRAWRVLRGRS